jgi:exoribonuclease R
MFPDLSTGLCSLNPNVDRLVQSCLMEVDRKGAVVRYEIHDGVIHSNARMTYTDVNAILTSSPETAAKCGARALFGRCTGYQILRPSPPARFIDRPEEAEVVLDERASRDCRERTQRGAPDHRFML